MTRIAIVLGVVCMLTGCYGTYRASGRSNVNLAYSYSTPSAVYVQQPPPQIHQARPQPPRPSPQAVWVAGHWAWQGRWVWVGGIWQTPRAGYVWTPPVAVQARAGGYEYHPGYWRRPVNAPPPVYRAPGTVRVSVNPAHVVVRGGVRVTPGPANVRGPGVRQNPNPPAGTVRVVPGRPAPPPRPTTTVTAGPARPAVVTPGRPARVTPPRQPVTPANTTGQGRVVVRPGGTTATATPGTGRVAVTPGGTSATATPGTGRVAVTPGGNTATAGGRRVTVAPGGASATATAGRRPAGATAVAPGVNAGARRNPASVQAVRAGGATATAGTRAPRGVTAAGSTAVAGRANLRCTMNTTIAPRGGYINLTGNGFGANVRVMIGGRNAVISSRRGSQLRVQIPRNSGGGNVVVSSGQRSAACGMLNVR